jgi:hypothetical protein
MHSVKRAQGFGLLGVSLFYDPENDGGVTELAICKIFQLFFKASLHTLNSQEGSGRMGAEGFSCL